MIEREPFFHPATSWIDEVTVMTFRSVKDIESCLLSDGYIQIERAERSTAAPEVGEYWTDITFSIVDRLAPEQATLCEA